MKVFIATLVILILAFAGVKALQAPSTSSAHLKHGQALKHTSQHEDMTQFSNDLAKFMKADVVKEGLPADRLSISAKCKPNQGVDGTRCWIVIKDTATGGVEKATSENVRRRGNKFIWDRES